MSTVTLAALKGVNETSIQRAGARYTPSINSNAPNLELRPLVNAVEALAQSEAYRHRLNELAVDCAKPGERLRAKFVRFLARDSLPLSYVQHLSINSEGKSPVRLARHSVGLARSRIGAGEASAICRRALPAAH